LFNKEKFYKED